MTKILKMIFFWIDGLGFTGILFLVHWFLSNDRQSKKEML